MSPSEPNDDELLLKLRQNVDVAAEILVRRHAGPLLAVIRRLIPHEEDARDALQDAFLSAFRAVEQFDGRSKLGTWLHRIAVNAALMKLRSKQRRPQASIESLLPNFGEEEHQLHPPAPWSERADDLQQRAETRAQVRQAIDQLPEIYRTVLLLRDIEELDTEETARMLGVSTTVVKTRLHRARQALRTLLDPYFRDPA
jgi:RNA polymerase sigma-70 factor (ECF subfamily)